MLLSERSALAVRRWLDLLSRNSVPAARGFLRHDSRYSDLTGSEYDAALDWLVSTGLVTSDGLPAPATRQLTSDGLAAFIFDTALVRDSPVWLPDADTTIQTVEDIPYDAASFAQGLGLSDEISIRMIHRAQYKIDLDSRANLGRLGELALIAALEGLNPGSTVHVAATDDGAGYDIALQAAKRPWHLEVKTTGRRGRLQINLTRNEHDTSLIDPSWILVVVALNELDQLAGVATVPAEVLHERCPRDIHTSSHWTATRYVLTSSDLRPGIVLDASCALEVPFANSASFSWMPTAGSTAEFCGPDLERHD